MIITIKQTIDYIQEDAQRYSSYKSRWKFSAGFWVTLSYRVRRLRKYGPKYSTILIPVDMLLGCIRWWISDTAISASTAIGPGLYLPHPNGIIINHMAVIGANVAIFQQVTIAEWHGAAAYIGDGSALFAGAKIIGGISIGKNCKVGANTVVGIDVPDDTSVSSAPPQFRARSGK